MDYDFVVFTETWLRDNVLNSEIMADSYQVFRRDRIGKSGGGVLIAIKTKYVSEFVKVTCDSDIEFLCVKVLIPSKTVYITCSYIPPCSGIEVYQSHIDALSFIISCMKLGDIILILGDFNLPNISWYFSSETFSFIPSSSFSYYKEILDAFADLGLYQMNNVCNVMGRVLDLVFVDNVDYLSVCRIDPISVPEDNYHPTLCLILESDSVISAPKRDMVPMKSFCFGKANFAKLNMMLRDIDWSCFLSSHSSVSSSMDLMIESFYDIIVKCFSECIPISLTNLEHSGPPWNSKELSRLKNRKSRLFKKFVRTGAACDYNLYSAARAEYNLLGKNCYARYLERLKMNFARNPKSFYDFVRVKRKSSSFPPRMFCNDNSSSDYLEIADMFADFFQSTYSDFGSVSNTGIYKYQSLIRDVPVSSLPSFDTLTIFKSLTQIKFSNKPGPDGIPACVLRNCAGTLCVPLTSIFNHLLQIGYFPVKWRESFIIPLYKSGGRSDIRNYRGIAKLSAIPKLFEKLVTDHLSYQVKSIMSPFQHGFLEARSTVTNLLEFSTHVFKGFVDNEQTDVIYTDFSKAFDRVDHNILLLKLRLIGIHDTLLSWIQSYLSARTQKVLFNNVVSKVVDVTSGVPQGSHLGPLLFLLFLNDLPSVILNCKILMYADDVKLFHSFSSDDGYITLQNDLNLLVEWCGVNLMELNLRKCKHMVFHRRKIIGTSYFIDLTLLETVETFLDLGVLMDRKLDFIGHVGMICNRARSTLGFVKRWSREFSDPYITKQLYMSLVRPLLEYASIVWNPYYHVHIGSIESVQKQFLLFCLRGLGWNSEDNFPSYVDRLRLIRLPTLESRRTMCGVCFVFGLIKGNVDSGYLLSRLNFNVPCRFTRHFCPLYLDYYRTNYANSSPFRRICNDFNNLQNIIDYDYDVVKLKRDLIDLLN